MFSASNIRLIEEILKKQQVHLLERCPKTDTTELRGLVSLCFAIAFLSFWWQAGLCRKTSKTSSRRRSRSSSSGGSSRRRSRSSSSGGGSSSSGGSSIAVEEIAVGTGSGGGSSSCHKAIGIAANFWVYRMPRALKTRQNEHNTIKETLYSKAKAP